MGADFLLATAPVPLNNDTAAKRIGKLSTEELFYAMETVYGEDDLTPEEAKDAALEALRRITADNTPRDMGIYSLNGKEFFLTGGMSWGDSPTDSFNDINFVDILGITDDELWE